MPLLIQAALQATQVGNLTKVLVLFTDQLAEHTTNRKIVRQGTSATHFRERDALGMDVEFAGINAMQVHEGLLAHRIKVALQVFEVRIGETGHLRCSVTHSSVVLRQSTVLVPPVALPDLHSILGETVQPAVLHPGDMPDHKADGIRFRPGAPGQFGRREALQRAVETPFTLIEGLFKESFELHSDSSWAYADVRSEYDPMNRGCLRVHPLAAIVFWCYSPLQQRHRVQH